MNSRREIMFSSLYAERWIARSVARCLRLPRFADIVVIERRSARST
jgi:hypothetical protein